jgi:tetratricopeptide (TPR) repeat protein
MVEPGNVGNELLVVVENTYQEQQNTPEGNELLTQMATILEQIAAPGATSLAIEINAWLDGRDQANQEQYTSAIPFFDTALEKSQQRVQPNPGVLFDHAITSIALKQYDVALADFNLAIELDNNRALDVKSSIIAEPDLVEYWRENQNEYPNITSSISISAELPPTATPTTTLTPTPAFTPTPVGWLFYDDFEGYSPNPSDDFEQTYEYYNLAVTVSQFGDEHGNVLILVPEDIWGEIRFGDTWQNYAVEYDLMISGTPNRDGGSFFSLNPRSNLQFNNDPYTHYSYNWDIFWKVLDIIYGDWGVNGEIFANESLTSLDYSPEIDRWYHVRAEVQDDLLSWYIDDVLMLRVRDSRISSGHITMTFGDCTGLLFYFDNILVESLD